MSRVNATEGGPGPTFWVLLLGIPVLFFAIMYPIDGQKIADERWLISEGDGVLLDTDQPPGPETAWTRVKIPRKFAGTPGRTSIWWRFELPEELQTPGLEWMLVVPSPRQTNFALWIDRHPIATRGDLDSSRSMLQNPVTFSVTNSFTESVPEVVYLRTVSPLPELAMSSIVIGPKTELTDYADYMDAAKRITIQAIMAMMALLAFLMASVWMLRRGSDPVYGWYAALLLIWTAHLSHTQIEHPPFGDAEFWRHTSHITLGWFVITASVFVDRLSARKRPRLDLALLLIGLSGSVLLLMPSLLGQYFTFFVVRIWVPVIIGIGFVILFSLLSNLRERSTMESRSLLILAFSLILIGIRDYLYNSLTLLDGNFLYLPFAAGFALIVFSIILIRRFVAALNIAEHVNEELEARVAEKTRELAEQHARTLALEHEQVLSRERQRLLQEMHDGLGGHMVHALAIAERSESLRPMVSPLKLAMEDLRLIIDSLDPRESAFDAVFSSLRSRIARTTNALQMRLTWQFDSRLGDILRNPHEVLTLARIVQESVTNVIKHADASELTIFGAYESVSGRVTLSITDDGRGPGSDESSTGRGLTTMKSRAVEIGGILNVIALDPGTRIEFTWYPHPEGSTPLTNSGDSPR